MADINIPAGNSREFLGGVLRMLAQHGIETWVFGGWGEELRGLAAPRAHRDIDLLYPQQDFARLDQLLSSSLDLKEITGKHLTYKRAFVLGGIMVELFLVQSHGG